MPSLKYFMSEKLSRMGYTEATKFLKAAVSTSAQHKNVRDKELLLSTFPDIKSQRYLEDNFSLTVSTLQSASIHVLHDAYTSQIL